MKDNIFKAVKHPLFSGSLIMMIGSNSANFFNLLYHFIMGKMLGPGSYGELAAIISLLGLLGIIPVSLSLVVIKYVAMAKGNSEISALISWFKTKVLLFSLIFSGLIFFASPIIFPFLRLDNAFYLILVVIGFFFSTLALINRSILQGLLKFKEMIISLLAETALKLLISILLVYLGFQVSGAIGGFALSVILGWYITNFYLRHLRKQVSVKVNRKQILSFITPVLIQSFATTSLYSSDVVLVKHFFPSHEAGLYGALSTLGKIIFFGAGPIGAVMFPMISRRSSRGEGYSKIFIYSSLATLLISIVVLLIYWLLPKFVISVLYGSFYLEASNLLVWFGIFMTLFTLSSLLINFNLSLGRTKVVLIPIVAAVLQIIAIWFYHDSLSIVIMISILITALLLGILLIYSSYEKRAGNKFSIGNSSRL